MALDGQFLLSMKDLYEYNATNEIALHYKFYIATSLQYKPRYAQANHYFERGTIWSHIKILIDGLQHQ